MFLNKHESLVLEIKMVLLSQDFWELMTFIVEGNHFYTFGNLLL
jgi:hypothetical protein